jgi:hypothetical protein
MATTARKLLLPQFTLTEVADENDADAVTVSAASVPYKVRPMLVAREGRRRDGKPNWVKHQFNLFPLVLDGQGVPWAEGSVYILSRLEGQVAPNMSTYASIADDLAAYRRFLDENGVDWTRFPVQKLVRPTYRFNGHLKFGVSTGEIAAETAKRRMRSIIGFYRWLISEGALIPDNEPWKQRDHYVDIKDAHGFSTTKMVLTTDLAIRVQQQNDPYDYTIDDGGKLRPLVMTEQEWLIDALTSLGNTEMTLIHVFGLLTGARIQTILTFRVRHALLDMEGMPDGELRFPIGPGTGVDNKHDKRMVLHIPVWFYRLLQTYAMSERAKKRRVRATGGDTEDQHLFLSQRGAPLYQDKLSAQEFDATNELRHKKAGQGVRQFITERVIPYIKEKHKEEAKNFHYRFHDTRATAGMNWTDHQLELVEQGKATLHEAREFVKTRMGHESSATTDRYLQYRRNLKHVRWAEKSHETHLQQLARKAMEGVL